MHNRILFSSKNWVTLEHNFCMLNFMYIEIIIMMVAMIKLHNTIICACTCLIPRMVDLPDTNSLVSTTRCYSVHVCTHTYMAHVDYINNTIQWHHQWDAGGIHQYTHPYTGSLVDYLVHHTSRC